MWFIFFKNSCRSYPSELPSLSLQPTQREGRPLRDVSPSLIHPHSWWGTVHRPPAPPQAPTRKRQPPLCEHRLDRPTLHSLAKARSPANITFGYYAFYLSDTLSLHKQNGQVIIMINNLKTPSVKKDMAYPYGVIIEETIECTFSEGYCCDGCGGCTDEDLDLLLL